MASVLSLVLFPVLTRLYDPAAIGRYGLFMAAVSLLGAVLTLRFDLAVLACPHDERGNEQASALCRLSLLVGVGVALAVGVVAVLLVAAGVLGAEMRLLALGALGTAMVSLQVTIDARRRRYSVIACLSILRVVLFVVFAAALSNSLGGAVALCLAAVLATLPSAVRVLLMVPLAPARAPRLPELFVRNWRFPAFQAPAAALNAAPLLVLTVWVDRVAGPIVLGFVIAASRIQLAAPGALSASVNAVFTNDVVAAGSRPDQVRRLYRSALWTNTLVTAAAAMVAVALAPWLQALLGPDWVGLRPYLLASFPFALAMIIIAVPTALLGVTGEQRRVLTSRVMLLLALAAGLVLATVLKLQNGQFVAVGTSLLLAAAIGFAALTYARARSQRAPVATDAV